MHLMVCLKHKRMFHVYTAHPVRLTAVLCLGHILLVLIAGHGLQLVLHP